MSSHGCFRLVSPADLERLRADPAALAAVLASDDPRLLEVHKAWQGLHYLLTKSAAPVDGPLGFVLGGGAPLFGPDEVAAIAAALEALPAAEVAARFDGPWMDELGVYPGGWAAKEVRWRAALVQHFDDVRALVRDGSRARLGLLVYRVESAVSAA
jgi:Domain of unknown function (DUF1877)